MTIVSASYAILGVKVETVFRDAIPRFFRESRISQFRRSDTGLLTRHDYHPFGEEIARTGYGSDTIRKQFTGYERDGETGLDFAQARYFGSATGRFTSPDDFINDTLAPDPQSWNLYVYVRNNPLRFIDPTGEKIWVVYEEDEEYEENGEKKKRSVLKYLQYRDNQLWTDYGKQVKYDGSNMDARKIEKDLNEIVKNGGGEELKRLAEDNLFHGIQHRDFGDSAIRGGTDPTDDGYAVWERGDTKTGSMTFYDTRRAEADSRGNTAAALGRELLGPASDFANAQYTDYDPYRYRIYEDVPGTTYQRSEVWRMQIDARVRRDFNLPERQFFGNQRIPKGSVVCEWALRNGTTSC